MSHDQIRIIVVDDSALFRLLIRDVLSEIPGCTVVGKAENGTCALEIIKELSPDLVTLDVEMPDMNGIEVLRKMKQRGDSSQAIMVSRLTDTGTQVTTDALLEGAFDFVLKPSGKNPEENKLLLYENLKEKINAFKHSRQNQKSWGQQPEFTEKESEPDSPSETITPETGRYKAVLIGTSTGGPEALREVLPKFPADFPLPILVVQHIPLEYTSRLANRLNGMCPLKVTEATDNIQVRPGTILIAPGGRHMKVISRNKKVIIRLTNAPPENSCRPAVDYLFRSAADVWGDKAIGVIMTGMGQDGTEGCLQLREKGGYIIAQSQEGCVVYGMPKSVIDNDLSHRVTKLQSITSVIIQQAQRK